MAMKRVLRQTIDSKKLADLNKRLLTKVSTSSGDNSNETALAKMEESGGQLQRTRVNPDEVTVQYKHNKDLIGLTKSKN